MFSIRDISIKNKLVLMQVFTSILVLGLCFAAFVVTDIRGYKEREVNSTTSIAQVIASNSVSSIQFMDNEAARDILLDLKKVKSDVVNAGIIDNKGHVFATYTKSGKPAYQFSPPFTGSEFAGKYLLVSKKIIENNETLGTVCLRVELTELEEIKAQKFRIAATLLIIGIALAFFIALINQSYISKPILSLVSVMKSIREHNDYDKQVQVKGNDEISMLSSEFNNLMEEVAASNRKKDEFIGIASHELKTPLTSVKLYLETLAKRDHEQQTKLFVLKARDGVNKLQSLILDLLDVSKIQSGQLQLNLRTLDIEHLIDESIQDAQLNVNRHHIIWKNNGQNILVLADKDRLEQVITNILSNAVKYSQEGQDIIIKAESNDSTVTVSIKDYGYGIPKSEHTRIFERFYRAQDSNAVISGFGLGLYICSQIIKRHKGTIWVESEEEKGSTFYFTIPRIKP